MDQAFQDLLLQNLKQLKEGQDSLNAGQDAIKESITEMKVSHAALETKVKNDARWIAGIGTFVGAVVSSGIHFAFKR